MNRTPVDRVRSCEPSTSRQSADAVPAAPVARHDHERLAGALSKIAMTVSARQADRGCHSVMQSWLPRGVRTASSIRRGLGRRPMLELNLGHGRRYACSAARLRLQTMALPASCRSSLDPCERARVVVARRPPSAARAPAVLGLIHDPICRARPAEGRPGPGSSARRPRVARCPSRRSRVELQNGVALEFGDPLPCRSDRVIVHATCRRAVAGASAVRRICRIRAISPSRSRMVSPLRRTVGRRRERRIAPTLLLGHLPDDEPAVLDLFSDELQLLPPFLLGAFPCRLRSDCPARCAGHRRSPFAGEVTFVQGRFACRLW